MTQGLAVFAAIIALIAMCASLLILALVIKLFTEYTKDRAQDARLRVVK